MRAEIVVKGSTTTVELTNVTEEQADAWVDGAVVDHHDGTVRTWVPAANVAHGAFLPDL